MGTSIPVSALQSFDNKPVQVYAVTRQKWLPIIETAETFLAFDQAETAEIAEELQEELRVLIGEEVGPGGSRLRYDQLMAKRAAKVLITPVTIQPTIQH